MSSQQARAAVRYEAQFEDQACVLCGGATTLVLNGIEDTRFGAAGKYSISLCSACGLEQIDPRPPAHELKHFYETYYNFGGERHTTYTRCREWFFSSWLYRLWLMLDGDGSFHTIRGGGRLLDIGCNEGRGLKIYRRNGFCAEGLELNPRAANVAREAGFTVHEAPLEDFEPGTAYDVAVLSNVLEHSLDPRRMLRDVARILKPGGQVWISCPNSQSWWRRRFGRSWINWHVPFHIVHFSASTLSGLLAETGLATIDIRQITPALWVASSMIARHSFRPGQPTRLLRNPVILPTLLLAIRGFLFPLLWWQNHMGRGDCLVVRAGKSEPGM